jgi:hypothetical protein
MRLQLTGVTHYGKNNTHNPPSREAMVKGRQISYQISNSRGSGHSPPYEV